MNYPKSLANTINYFKKFPGVGEKSAERMALAVMNFTAIIPVVMVVC